LTFDGSTGELSGQATVEEATTIECEVTAHEANVPVPFTTNLRVAVNFLSYGKDVLLCLSGSTSFTPTIPVTSPAAGLA
jgi:hypothetical protein